MLLCTYVLENLSLIDWPISMVSLFWDRKISNYTYTLHAKWKEKEQITEHFSLPVMYNLAFNIK